MVAATSGGQLSDEHGALYHYVGVVCFWLTLTTAIPLFAYCFWSFMRHRYHPSGAAAGTAWIPLGVVGQSTAASTVLFDAHLYGIVMFVIGVPCSEVSQVLFRLSRWENLEYAKKI